MNKNTKNGKLKLKTKTKNQSEYENGLKQET